MRKCVWRQIGKTKDILKIRLGEKWIPPFTARAAASLVNSSGTSSSLSLVLDLRSSLKLRGQTQVFPCFPATGVGEKWKLSAMVTRRLRSLHCKRMVPTAASTQLRATSNHPMLQWFITVNLNQVSIVWHINWLNSKLEFLWKLKGVHCNQHSTSLKQKVVRFPNCIVYYQSRGWGPWLSKKTSTRSMFSEQTYWWQFKRTKFKIRLSNDNGRHLKVELWDDPREERMTLNISSEACSSSSGQKFQRLHGLWMGPVQWSCLASSAASVQENLPGKFLQ